MSIGFTALRFSLFFIVIYSLTVWNVLMNQKAPLYFDFFIITFRGSVIYIFVYRTNHKYWWCLVVTSNQTINYRADNLQLHCYEFQQHPLELRFFVFFSVSFSHFLFSFIWFMSRLFHWRKIFEPTIECTAQNSLHIVWQTMNVTSNSYCRIVI